ncbi:MAG: S1 family peptidase, partial [Planctomycetota bacterium]
MRRGWLGILFAFILLSVSQGRALAIYEALPYVYRLKVAQCSQAPQARVQTGFRVEGIDGIITALHGVVGCESITAHSDDGNRDNNLFRNLVIREVDIERDVALLWSDDMENALPGGLEEASPAAEPSSPLRVMGYPLGLSTQRPLLSIEILSLEKLVNRIPDYDPSKKILLKRQSPSLEIMVLDLQTSLVPGHSGAPLLTADGRVFGVANGGLKEGAIEISWAIPWHEIEWRPVESELTRLTELNNFSLSDLSFSSTYPNYESIELDTQSLPVETLRSYRAFSYMYMSGRIGDQDVEGWLGFETDYNKDGNQRRLIGVDNLTNLDQKQQQDTTEEQFLIISFDNQDYKLPLDGFQAECLKLDGIPETIKRLVEMTDNMVSTPFSEEELALAAHLGTEVINGEDTNHYLLLESTPVDVTETGSLISEMIGAEIWVTVGGNQPRKISLEMAFYEDSSMPDQAFIGNMYIEIAYSDINTDVTVDLPLVCQNASLASDVNSASDTGAMPQSAPDDGRAMITEPIPVQHNVSGPQGPSMSIQPTITVENLAEMPGVAIVRIFSENDIPLLAYSPETGTLDGIYQVEAEFTPGFEETIYEGFEILVPYNDLSLVDGIHNLKFRVFVYDLSTETVLAESDFHNFSLWQQTDEDGNRNWFSDGYSGLSGLTVAGQTEVSPLEQDVGNFLSHAF